MKTGRVIGLLAGALAAAIMLPFGTPAYADTATDAPEPQLEAQEDGDYSDIVINLNCPDDYGSPFADDEAYNIGFNTNSFEHDTVRWSVYAGQWDEDGEVTKLSGDLTAESADYLVVSSNEGSEGYGTVNVKKIYENYLTNANNPCVAVGATLLKGQDVIASEERYFEIQKPYQEINFFFNSDVNKVLAGSEESPSKPEINIFNAEHPWGIYNVELTVTSVVSSDESIVSAKMWDDESDGFDIISHKLGTATLTFFYECEDHPELKGSFERVFEVVDHRYDVDVLPEGHNNNVLPGGTLDFTTRIYFNEWDGQHQQTTEGLKKGQSIVYEVSDAAPKGTTITTSQDNPLNFTIHVPASAEEYATVFMKVRILDQSGAEVFSNDYSAAYVCSDYYTPIYLIDKDTGEAWGNSIELAIGKTATFTPKVNHVTTEGSVEVTGLTWYAYCEDDDRLSITKNADGSFTVELLNGEHGSSALEVMYENENGETNTFYCWVEPLRCDEHQWETTLESLPTDSRPGSLLKRCTVCGTEEREEVTAFSATETYWASHEPAFTQLVGLIFKNQLGSIEQASPSSIVTFTRLYYGVDSDQGTPVCISYRDFVGMVDSLFSVHGGLEDYLSSDNYIYADKDADVLVFLTPTGGFGDPDDLSLQSVDQDDNGKILHARWLSPLGTTKPKGIDEVDYVSRTYYGSNRTEYFSIGQYVRIVVNGERQIVAYEPETLTNLKGATVKVGKLTYTGKALSPKVTVTLNGTVVSPTMYALIYRDSAGNTIGTPNKVGTYTVLVSGRGDYVGASGATFSVAKGTNPLKVSGKKVTVKLAKVAKANQTIDRKKALKVTGAQGKVTYKKSSGNKKITINKTTGKITVKKGLKKGTYKVKIKVSAAGNANYNSLSKTVTVTITVK